MSFSVPMPSAGPSNAPLAQPISVVSSQFLASFPVNLYISEKSWSFKEGAFTVTDVDGKIMFKVQGSIFSLHDTRKLLDSVGTPMLTFRQKMLSMHMRWQVYRGDSCDSKDLLFNAKKSKVLQFKTELHVFLAGNTKEEQFDFKVIGSYSDKACTIYSKENSIIAQMHKDTGFKNKLLDKDVFLVTVYPQVDFAFIVALVVVLYEINQDRRGED